MENLSWMCSSDMGFKYDYWLKKKIRFCYVKKLEKMKQNTKNILKRYY